MKRRELLKNAVLCVYDAVVLFFAAFFAYIIVYGGAGGFLSYAILLWYIVTLTMIYVTFYILGVNRMVFCSAGFAEALKIAVASAVVCAFNVIFVVLYDKVRLGFACSTVMMFFLAALAGRFYKRFFSFAERYVNSDESKERVMIVGAGSAGTTLIREMRTSNKLSLVPVCLIDDNPRIIGRTIDGVKVVGNTDSIKEMADKYSVDTIIVAMPSVPKHILKVIYNKCQDAGKKVKTVPGIYQLINGSVSVAKLRDINILDLLGRAQVEVNLNEIMGYIEGRTVLVTGVGSIGSELCRQIATHKPKLLIMIDIYENNAYDIEQELKAKHPELNLLTLIASVRNTGRIENIFEKYRPEIVFNAAAHKHVPLMETSPNEAVKNNVFGTLCMARCADKYGALKFVQISTDKAVNPTNIMGATKRICEMIIQTIGRHSETDFVAVRFGNVLGSNGSVIPLFRKQIEAGGPVTVTHKDIIRYFMTIPEAVSLVLQAGAYAKGGQIFVLDMGEPVKIYDLACNLIRLSGYEPGVDIEIKCIGLRPGEKLYEERLMAEEGLEKTENELISIGKPLDIDEDNLFRSLDELYKAAYDEVPNMKELVHKLVPTYTIDNR